MIVLCSALAIVVCFLALQLHRVSSLLKSAAKPKDKVEMAGAEKITQVGMGQSAVLNEESPEKAATSSPAIEWLNVESLQHLKKVSPPLSDRAHEQVQSRQSRYSKKTTTSEDAPESDGVFPENGPVLDHHI